jgi:hypothetical protein
MSRLFLPGLLLAVLLLTACPSTTPPPCTGEDCPVPCENVSNAEFGGRGLLTSESDMKNCYAQGTSTTVSFKITPTDNADLDAERAVIVFAVIEDDRNKPVKKWEDVTTDVLDVNRISVSPDIFSDPLPMSQVAAGLAANVSFKIRDSAPEENFGLIISIFRLKQGQTPDQVTRDDSAVVGRANYWFRVE